MHRSTRPSVVLQSGPEQEEMDGEVLPPGVDSLKTTILRSESYQQVAARWCACVSEGGGGRGMSSWPPEIIHSLTPVIKLLYIFTYLKSVGRGSVCIQIMSLVSLCCDVTAGSRLPLVPTLPYTQSPTQFSCPFLFCARRLCNELRV